MSAEAGFKVDLNLIERPNSAGTQGKREHRKHSSFQHTATAAKSGIIWKIEGLSRSWSIDQYDSGWALAHDARSSRSWKLRVASCARGRR